MRLKTSFPLARCFRVTFTWLDFFLLAPVHSGNHLYVPPESQPGRSPLKLTACAPLFFHTYRIRDAGTCPLVLQRLSLFGDDGCFRGVKPKKAGGTLA
jgi:hypothetical protein